MTTLLRCAVCARDWTHGPDDSGDPMVSWYTDRATPLEVRDFGLVCNGCSRAWRRQHHEQALWDHHLSWWVGPGRALAALAAVLEGYRWPVDLSRRVAAFAVEAAAIPSPKRRAK